jgi:hypothetical protein
MEAAADHVIQKLERLFSEAAELAIEKELAQWDPNNPPHYSQIEEAAHRLARQLSCRIQERAAREVAAREGTTADCPACGRSCELGHQTRTVQSIDGPIELLELSGFCPRCRRAFFPSAGSVGPGQSGVDALPGAADRLRVGGDAVG